MGGLTEANLKALAGARSLTVAVTQPSPTSTPDTASR